MVRVSLTGQRGTSISNTRAWFHSDTPPVYLADGGRGETRQGHLDCSVISTCPVFQMQGLLPAFLLCIHSRDLEHNDTSREHLVPRRWVRVLDGIRVSASKETPTKLPLGVLSGHQLYLQHIRN